MAPSRYPHLFSEHFGKAPVIEVSGRTFPVEHRYRPLGAEDRSDRNLQNGILAAAKELWAHGRGDILVFLSGEREIRETATFLGGRLRADCEVVQLFARLSSTTNSVAEPCSVRALATLAVIHCVATVSGVSFELQRRIPRSMVT